MLHLLDQPQNPRIRTKICRLPDEVDREFFDRVNQLRTGQLDVDTYQKVSLDYFLPLVSSDSFSDFVEEVQRCKGQLELVRRHLDHCRYTVLLYHVNEGEVHPPHHHFNVASTQIVVEGKLRIREFERVRRDDDGVLYLRQVRDGTLGPGEPFQASEWSRNVHWFQAVDGPAIVFNTNARGFETKTFDQEEGRFGRRYIDPTGPLVGGVVACEEFDEAEAEKRFQNRSLDDFPPDLS